MARSIRPGAPQRVGNPEIADARTQVHVVFRFRDPVGTVGAAWVIDGIYSKEGDAVEHAKEIEGTPILMTADEIGGHFIQERLRPISEALESFVRSVDQLKGMKVA